MIQFEHVFKRYPNGREALQEPVAPARVKARC